MCLLCSQWGAERLCCTQRFTVQSPILSIHCEAHAVVRRIWTAGHSGMVHIGLKGGPLPQAEALGAGIGP